ncbi:MAG TPA: hypothetical protein VER12_03390 [Polyangiaceae bacterium]|nr:hypothetical protein [Polyangiaceae bacterium]
MFRVLVCLCSFALLLWSCGPDKAVTCSGEDPTFELVIRLTARPLPADTVVRVTYGGSGKEDFRLSDPDARHEVTFCKIADDAGAPLDGSSSDAIAQAGAAGAAGAAAYSGDSNGVAALYCELWTGGFTELHISGSGFSAMDYELVRKKDQCTLRKEIVLDSPDAG